MSTLREKLAQKKTKLAAPRERLEDHPADVNNYQDGGFYIVPIADIQPNPDQPRQFFDPDSLAELTESVRQQGVLQPVIVRREADGRIVLVAGERRLRAARQAKLETIPAMLTRGSSAEIALIENLQREDLRPIEEAEALARMLDEYGYTQEQLARVIGKARSTVTETLSLARLPEAIKDECRRADTYPRRLLVEIAKQPTATAMVDLFKQVKQKNLKSDGLRELTRKRPAASRRPLLAVFMERINDLTAYLGRVRLDSLSEEEKAGFLRSLRDLRRAVDQILD